ncbi:hypothetical protein KVR01_010819 [Diaporthe batatas]|uniref:uncharacterized protein n=1 Tax=Diaporthe batatas TaxID=748121 RepID=UPI001D0521E0|nr:uncharacterized protein KVR01_010819 [Diaporthe batatas]KAG8159158.1 hypothetical protein KVR01_010819 [Diaporthe batatas]
MDNSRDDSDRGDQDASPDRHDHARRRAVQRAGERTHAVQRADVAQGLLRYTHNPEGVVARGSVDQAPNSQSPAPLGAADDRQEQPRGNSLNLAVRGARPTTTVSSAQALGRDDDGWTTGSFAAIRADRARARARAQAGIGSSQTTRNGQASNNAFIADGPLPSADGAAPAQGTMPAVGHEAWITVQCPNDQFYTVRVDLSNAMPSATYNITINIPACPPQSPPLPRSPQPSPSSSR